MRPKLTPPPGELDRHVAWRTHCLREAGFSAAEARWPARDLAFDLHALLALVDRGCPPELAVRILAPLDPEGGE